MAAPLASFIQMPDDSGNTGKKIRTQTRVIGADTVHEHFFVMSGEDEHLGTYMGHSGNLTIQAAAQNGTSTGFAWFFNPIGSTVKIAVRRINCIMQFGSALSVPTAPRVVASKFTYTGTPSGAAVALERCDTTYPSAQASLRTAMTGMTITLGNTFGGVLPPMAQGTAGWAATPAVETDIYEAVDWDDMIFLSPGEGVVVWQPDAGTTSDTRKLLVDFRWEEVSQ